MSPTFPVTMMKLGFGLVYFSALFGSSYGLCEEDLLLKTPQSILQALLPPSPSWDATRSVDEFVRRDGPFVTPTEASGFNETASYEEVTDFFAKLAAESPHVRVESIVTLANGEDVWLVTASGELSLAPNEWKNPILLATAGIHPGESSGVNAGMMFLRNLVMEEEYKSILESVNFLFVPILNVQGYLRQSPDGRINQHGPNFSGRRPNGSFKNLNRDFSKLDTPEIRAIVKVMTDHDISFYTDMHSTDGMNYQSDVTWCDNGDAGLSNEIHGWLRREMGPDLKSFLEGNYNHKTSVCYYANDALDPTKGYYPYFSDGPTYSTNYADHRQIPSYLLEIHSLKPNQQRVLGAYAYLLGLAKIISEKKDSLRKAIEMDRAERVDPVPIAWDYDSPAPMVEWPIFEYDVVTNPVLGIRQIKWTDVPLTITVEQSTRSTPLNPKKRPYAYVIPAVWTDAIEVLAHHGIALEILTEDAALDVADYRTEGASINRLREGRPEITIGDDVKVENCTRTYRKNDVLVKTDQDLGTLAVALLEPTGEGSLFLWGFFGSTLASHDHAENYIMIPLAEKMLDASAELSNEWETYKLENPSHANDTEKVVDWFFRRSAFYDPEAFRYPIGILYEEPIDNIRLAPFSLSSSEESTVAETSGASDISTFAFLYMLTFAAVLILDP